MGVPTALSEMIEMQIDRLDAADQRLLEAASLIGVIFPAWAAAAALAGDLEDIEDQYEKLTRRLHFLHPAGHDELPDGTQSAFYVFAHGMYREVLRADNLRHAAPGGICEWRRSWRSCLPGGSRMCPANWPCTSRRRPSGCARHRRCAPRRVTHSNAVRAMRP